MSVEREVKKSNPAELPAATPVRLSELVDYLPGTTVSRTLSKRATGTLTLFAFDEGEELSEHSAPFDAYVTILDGTGLLTIGGTEVITENGQTVRMPANVPHAVRGAGRFKMLLTMIRG